MTRSRFPSTRSLPSWGAPRTRRGNSRAARDGDFEALVSTRDGEQFSVGGFTVRDRKIVEIYILADPDRQIELAVLDD